MVEINLTNTCFSVFGLKGSGKTNFIKAMLSTQKSHLLYDTLHEYAGFNRYLPKYRNYSEVSLSELNDFIKKYVLPKGKRPRVFGIDECNRYCPNRKPLPDQVEELNDFNRHYGVSTAYLARRPVQLHTDLIELSNYLVFFRLMGKNDYRYMEDIADGLGDAVRALPKYHYVLVDEARDYQVCKPVKDMGKTPKM